MLIPVVLILNAIYLGSEARVLLPRSLNHTRIVGGEDIEITEAPYQVSIQINGRHYCGGVLVAKDTVLTAAHCTSYASALQVRVGTVFAEEGGQIYAVEKVVRHPNFSMAHLDSDLAVIRLSKPVELSDTVATINMKESDEEVNEGDALLVSGWGSDMPQAPPKLQRVELKKVDRETCLRIYAPAGITAITKTMLCAIAPGGGKGPCFGDSGGPLVHDGKLAGLVSFGIGCARERYPEVFAKVSALRSWIDETMKNITDFEVRVGTAFPAEDGQFNSVEKVVRHLQFSLGDMDFDVAIVRLSKPVKLSDTVAEDMKESDEEINDGDAVLVSRWGEDMPRNFFKLRRVELKIVNQETCVRACALRAKAITKNMICAGVPGGGKGSCHYDDGGPLVHDGKLAGLVSFSVGCARERFPSVFAKVSALRSWIDESMKNM